MSRFTKTTTALIIGALAIGVYYLTLKPKIGKNIKTKSGIVQGIISVSRDGSEFYEWLGIPYALPPVGELRFATPEPIKPWEGVHDASSYGYACAALNVFSLHQNGNEVLGFYIDIKIEDCLTLNIHAPKISSRKKIPVLVYIHGGAFMMGTSSEYRPDFFMDEDVIFVTMNYRLNILGFLSTQDENIRGNMGLKDQALAIKWIHDNIEIFGGDPNEITLMGESAGGVSVHLQLLSSQTRGLFKKAIALSGAATNTWGFVSPKMAEIQTKQIAATLNCPIDSSYEMTKCLRQVPTTELLQALYYDVQHNFLFFPHRDGHNFAPTVEKVNDSEAFLVEDPREAMVQGKAQRIPLLAGVVADEGLLSTSSFFNNEKHLNTFEDNWEEQITHVCDLSEKKNRSAIAAAIRNYYFPNSESMSYMEKLEQYKQLLGDCFFTFGVHRAAEVQREFSPVYLYLFNHHGGPTLVSAMNSYGDTFHPAIEFLWAVGKTLISEVLLGTPRIDYGVCHFDDMLFTFPFPIIHLLLERGSERHAHYHFSKAWVKFLVDFASKDSAYFMDKELKPLPRQGSVKYLEISNQPQELSPAFIPRLQFLKSVGIN